jgi:GntR family transcriptional regulator
MTQPPRTATDLPIRPVDPRSPIPLYHQVEIDLQTLIQSGIWGAEDLLPPEIELCKRYGVGRQTIRMALSRLAANHLIGRQAGRGTFVLPPPDRKQFYLDRSFTRQIQELGLATHSQVLHALPGTVGPNAPLSLRDHQGEPCFLLNRLRFGNDLPIGLQYTTIMTQRCPGLERFDFHSESLYDVLATHYQLMITQITHVVTALGADATQADLLHVSPGQPLLQVTTTAYLEPHVIIEASMSIYRTDHYEFSIIQTL